MTHFADRLTEANRQTGTVLCMGIDPHMTMIPALFGGGLPGSDAAVATMRNFANACLDQAIGKVAAIKPQAAFLSSMARPACRCLPSLGATR